MPDKSLEQFLRYLMVGSPATLDPRPDSKNSMRFSTVLRGWEADKWIIFDIPVVDGRRLVMGRRQECIVRLVSSGAVCAFRGSVLQSYDSGPRPHFMISWPNKVSYMNIRRHERLELNAACEIEFGEGKTGEGRVCDLSAGGCQLESEEPLSVGQLINLTFTLLDGYEVSGAQCIVRNVRQLRRGVSAGCQFTDDCEGVTQEVNFYITSSLARIRGVGGDSWILMYSEGAAPSEFQKVLEEWKFSVAATSDLVEFFYRVRFVRPAAVILHWPSKEPELPLPTVCSVLAKAAAMRGVKLFVSSGNPEVAQECLEKGASYALGVGETLADLVPMLPTVKENEPVPEAEPEEPAPAES